MSPNTAQTLLKYIGYSLADLTKLLPNNTGIAEVQELFAQLTALGLNGYCQFTPSLARGLNVYTGNVWEVFDASHQYTSSLGGGGRYDHIITNFVNNGVAYPAVGMSFGLEPITALLQQKANPNPIRLLIVPMGTVPQCHHLANQIRNQGIPTMLWTAKPKVTKALEYAAATQIRYVAVIGENEISSNTLSIKDLTTGQTATCQLNKIAQIATQIK